MGARSASHGRPGAGWGAGLRLGLGFALALALLGGAAGAWWGARQDDVHEATAVILLNPLQGNPFSPDARGDDLVNLETEAQLVTSDSVLDQLDAALGDPDDPADVDASRISVVVPTNTQLLAVTVSAASGAEAQDAAQTLAELYLDHRRGRTALALSAQRTNIDEQIRQRSAERAALVSRLDGLAPGSPGSSLLTQQILAAVTQIGELRTQLGEVGSASLDPGQLVTPAQTAPAGPLPAGPLVPGALGGLLGLAGGWVAARQLRRVGDVVRSREDLDVDAPVWGSITSGAGAVAAEGARLRTVVLAAHGRQPMVVLACGSGTRAALTSSETLAASLAAARIRTVLVDLVGGDEASGRTGEPPVPGLAEVLRDEVTLGSAVSWAGDLGRLAPGADDADLDDLAAAPEMDVVLLELVDDVSVVVLRGGPATSPRTQALAARADVVVLEVTTGRSTVAGVEDDLAELAASGAGNVGLVLVPEPPSRGATTGRDRQRVAAGVRRVRVTAARMTAAAPRARTTVLLAARLHASRSDAPTGAPLRGE